VQFLSKALKECDFKITPKFIMPQKAIKCMSQSKDQALISEANSILKRAESNFLSGNSTIAFPMSESYSLLLRALKNLDLETREGPNMVDVIQDLLSRIDNQIDAGNQAVRMDTHLNNNIMNALATASEKDPRAAKMVEDMINDPNRPLDEISFSIAIKALVTSKNWAIEHSMSPAERIEHWLEKGAARPNHKTMTPILSALAKQGKVSDIMHLLEWMESLFHEHGWYDVRPNRVHFNTMINALANQGSTRGKGQYGSGIEAVEVLDKMKRLYEEGGNNDVRPDIITYNAVLHAIAKERTDKKDEDTGARAEMLLQRLEQGEEGDGLLPDIVSYNTVLSAHMNSFAPDAATKMQNILDRMISFNIEPDLRSYTMCIHALSKSSRKGSAQKAEDFLRYMEESYEGGQKHLKPDIKCYNGGKFFVMAFHSNFMERFVLICTLFDSCLCMG
jgi:hypothetical protein